MFGFRPLLTNDFGKNLKWSEYATMIRVDGKHLCTKPQKIDQKCKNRYVGPFMRNNHFFLALYKIVWKKSKFYQFSLKPCWECSVLRGLVIWSKIFGYKDHKWGIKDCENPIFLKSVKLCEFSLY